VRMPRRCPPAVANSLPATLERLGISWGEVGRRTLLPPRLLARLRSPAANPRLVVAERVADALALPVDGLWILRRRESR